MATLSTAYANALAYTRLRKQGADLTRAELPNADVSWSIFTDANLKLVNLTGAARRGARGLEAVI